MLCVQCSNFFKKDLFIKSQSNKTRRDTEKKEREVFHPLVHPLNGHIDPTAFQDIN